MTELVKLSEEKMDNVLYCTRITIIYIVNLHLL